MAIDLLRETALSPVEASDFLPRRRNGKKPNVATIYRWMQLGVKGVRLEFVQVGGTRCTTREALQRFCEELTSRQNPAPSLGTRCRQRAAVKRAERVLDRAGI